MTELFERKNAVRTSLENAAMTVLRTCYTIWFSPAIVSKLYLMSSTMIQSYQTM
jgi:hypothetical protein